MIELELTECPVCDGEYRCGSSYHETPPCTDMHVCKNCMPIYERAIKYIAGIQVARYGAGQPMMKSAEEYASQVSHARSERIRIVESIETFARSLCPQPHCPQCGNELNVLLFMGKQPDGYVCDRCGVWLSENLKRLAHVIE